MKPLAYAVALHDLGTERTHQFVGKEPSGFRFNKLSLNDGGTSKELLKPTELLTPREKDRVVFSTVTSNYFSPLYEISLSHRFVSLVVL